MRQGRGIGATEAVFYFRQKSLFTPGCVPGAIIYFVCLVSGCITFIRHFYSLPELYEADIHKPGIYGSGRVWANAWDVFRRAPSRSSRGRLAAVDFVVCVVWGVFFVCFFSILFFLERTRPASSMTPPCLIYLSTSSDCESCTRPISTNPGSMEVDEYGL